jgi:hypothetical protein
MTVDELHKETVYGSNMVPMPLVPFPPFDDDLNMLLSRFQAKIRLSTFPISWLGFLKYVSLARLALFGRLHTISMPATVGLYILYHISTPVFINCPRS